MALVTTNTQNDWTSVMTPERAKLPDHANDLDQRELPLEQVGIENLSYPITVLDRQNERQQTVANVDLAVALAAEHRGTHMSRFVEVLDSMRGEMTIRRLPELLTTIQRRLEAREAFVRLRFPYFLEKTAPVSRLRSLMEYICEFQAKAEGERTEFTLSVEIPVKTLCPCSKAISAYGAHNQRTMVTARVAADTFVWVEDVIDAVESCASAPVYALLKREDEKFVTEQAYDNPVFVEDLVRSCLQSLQSLPGVQSVEVQARSHESIHKHEAVAKGRWSADDPSISPALPLRRSSEGFQFGFWLKERRHARQLSQGELARQLGISSSFLSRLESGDKKLPRELASDLANTLGLETNLVALRAGHLPEAIAQWVAAHPEILLAAMHSSPSGEVQLDESGN